MKKKVKPVLRGAVGDLEGSVSELSKLKSSIKRKIDSLNKIGRAHV